MGEDPHTVKKNTIKKQDIHIVKYVTYSIERSKSSTYHVLC